MTIPGIQKVGTRITLINVRRLHEEKKYTKGDNKMII
jgi:hypothetical protein